MSLVTFSAILVYAAPTVFSINVLRSSEKSKAAQVLRILGASPSTLRLIRINSLA